MKKWFTSQNSFVSVKGRIWLFPCVSIWYDRNTFLETGVVSPAFGIQISFLRWSYSVTIQQGY
jgi:hypothetical protein